jgi:CRP/FNR family transcriptional regulator, nitrogen fixation regulation protein
MEDGVMQVRSGIKAHGLQPAVARQNGNGAVGYDTSKAAAFELMGAPMIFKRNTEIYGENEPAEYLYKVVSGAVRTYRVLVDGRRQIGAFYLPGDVFGLESGSAHTFSAEAISETRVVVVKRSALDSAAARDSEIAQQRWAVTAGELHRAQDHFLALIKTAEERVVGFLLEMADRMSSGNQIELPMSRQDIADYLGLTIETVSRTMTHLESAAAINLPSSRRVVLRNRAALCRMIG